MKNIFFRITAFILKLISLLPFRILYLLSDLLFVFIFYIFKYRRKVVQTNLRNSFPEKTERERSAIERRFYKYFADLIVESVKSLTISEEELKKRYKYENVTAITKHLNEGRSVIAVSGHYGNWEWGPLAIPSELPEDVLIVYKPLSDLNFDKLILDVRSRFGAVMVPMKQTLRKVASYKNQPHVLVLVGDQTPTRGESQYFTNFLNQQTAIFLGVEKMAIKSDYAIINFSIKRIKRGYYVTYIEPLIDHPKATQEYEITNAHTLELEKLIMQKPELWLWSHRRWKFKPKDIAV